MVRSIAFIAVFAVLLHQPNVSIAASTSGSSSSDVHAMEYPELQVTPRASERLAMEAKDEDAGKLTKMLPFQISALATTMSGLLYAANRNHQRDPAGFYTWPAVGVGVAWLATSTLISLNYRPYTKATEKVSALPKQSKRDQLIAERIAEEELFAASTTMKRLTWISAITNIAANALIIVNADGTNAGLMTVTGGLGALLSLTPLVFKSHYIKVGALHQDYKKKIYGTFSLAPSMLREPGYASVKFAPGLELAYRF